MDFADVLQPVDLVAVGQQRGLLADHVFGQAVAERARRPVAVVLVGRIDELEHLPVRGEQGDVEVARVDQLVDHAVHLGVEVVQALGIDRQLGDAVERGLQFLGALAFDDLLLQLDVGALQLQRARLHALLELRLRLLAVQRGEDVLGDEAEQGLLLAAVAVGAVVALHHDGAAYPVFATERHAQPIEAVGAGQLRTLRALVHGEHARDEARRAVHRLAMPQQRKRQAARQFAAMVGPAEFEQRAVLFVGEIQEAQGVLFIVVLDDIAVVRVHQRVDHRMHAPQHLAQFEIGTGQVGDLVQGLLQLFGFFQFADAQMRIGRVQRGIHQDGGQLQPGVAPAIVACSAELENHAQSRAAVGAAPDATGFEIRETSHAAADVLQRVFQLLHPPRRDRPGHGTGQAEHPVVAGHRNAGARRQLRPQGIGHALQGQPRHTGSCRHGGRWLRTQWHVGSCFPVVPARRMSVRWRRQHTAFIRRLNRASGPLP